jgi:hypothetical protein
MSSEFNKSIIAVLTPPFRAVGFIIGNLYKLLFGVADNRRAKENEARFARDIHNGLPFLFDDVGGTIVVNRGLPFPPAFDYAFITIVAGNLFFVFSRGRGELNVEVAPRHLQKDGYELSFILNLLVPTEDIRRGALFDLVEVSRFLRPHMNLLNEAFSPELYPSTRQILAGAESYDRAANRQWEAEIDRRLYHNT